MPEFSSPPNSKLSPQKTAPSQPYTAPTGQMWAWGVGALASHFMIQTFGQASAIFTVGFGINAVILGWAMMMPRFVDALLDPYLGHLSDNTHTRWGRRKPYLLIGAILGAIFLCAMWWANPAWSETTLLIYLAVLGTCCYLCYGLYTMAWTAVGYELTDDYNERSRVAAIGAFFLAIVSFSAAWIFRVALLPIFGVSQVVDGKVTGDAVVGMRYISVAVSLIIIIAAIIAARGCRERFTHANKKHESLLPALKTTTKNRPFVILLLIKVCQLFGDRLSGALLSYLAIYYVCSGNKELGTQIQGIAGTIGTVWSFILLPFLKPFSQKFGKRAAMIMGATISLLAACAQPFILNPKHPYLLLTTAIVVAPLLLISNTIANAVVPDICDLDELQTGERREGLFTSVMGFMAKMEISLCTLIVGYMVAWSGLNLKLTTAQPPEVLSRLFYLAIVPNIVFSLGAFILTLKFPMTEASMNEVRRQLDARHHAQPETAPDNETGLDPDEELTHRASSSA